MPCCGSRRVRAAIPAPKREQGPRAVGSAPAALPPVIFEYTGKTALAVTGPITHAIYRFSVPGARVPVDARDAGAVAAVPNVRRTAY
jgi:hypothetical protein